MKHEDYYQELPEKAVILDKKERITPAYFRISPVNINGLETQRLMIVLRTQGCEYARKTGGCTVCGFMNSAVADISASEIVNQLDDTLETMDLAGVEEIDLLTLGSFFNDNEVSSETRCQLLERIAALPNIKRVSFESRAEYVTLEKLKECKSILGQRIIDFGIGLESADDYIRNKIIKKGLSKSKFEEVAQLVKAAGCHLLVYLLIKPPFLSEGEAIDDAVDSVKYVYETAKRYGVKFRAAFEPVFICKNTPLEDLFMNSKYRLVNLWSVVEVIKRTHAYGEVFVGLSDEDLSYDRMPSSCEKCSQKIINEIERFNKTQEVSSLEQLDCSCKIDYLEKLERGII
jgi:archaeosine synthase beta-subunit